jgi:hypothetical protein
MEKCYKIPTIIIGIKVSGTKELFFFIRFKLAANQTQKEPWQYKTFSSNIHPCVLCIC